MTLKNETDVRRFVKLPCGILALPGIHKHCRLSVYVAVRVHARKTRDGQLCARPGIKRLAEVLKLSKTTVREALVWLEKTAQVLVRKRRFGHSTVTTFLEPGSAKTDTHEQPAERPFVQPTNSQHDGHSKAHEGPLCRARIAAPPALELDVNLRTRLRPDPPTPQANKSWPDGFDTFWKSFPKKVAKEDALKAWTRLKPDAELQATMLAALEAHKRSDKWLKDDGEFTPHPATWIRGKRWKDELPKPGGQVADQAGSHGVDWASPEATRKAPVH